MARFCESCGLEIGPSDLFCCFCGAPVKTGEAQAEAEEEHAGYVPTMIGGSFCTPGPMSAGASPLTAPASSDELAEDPEDYTPTLVLSQTVYALVRVSTGERYEFSFPCTVGRGSSCDLRILGNPAISRTHARLTLEGEDVFVEDLSSTNSTFVDGEQLTDHAPCALPPNAILRLGDEDLRFVEE